MIDQPELSRSTRRFRLVDLVVIVAASAFSLWLYRICISNQSLLRFPMEIRTLQDLSMMRGGFLYRIDWLFAIGFTVVGPGGAALIILGLFRPRPLLRERFRQPGLLACLAASTIVARAVVDVEIGSQATYQLLGYRFLEESSKYVLPQIAWNIFPHGTWNGDLVPTAVAACWLTLWISGVWARSTDWVEKAARVVGAYWFLAWMVHSFHGILTLCHRLFLPF
jgi:hypothetical protein